MDIYIGFNFLERRIIILYMKENVARESLSRPESTDDQTFREIRNLIEEGWQLRGNFFQKDQTYKLVLSREGEEDKIFSTKKPYPQIVNATGKTKEIP